MTAGSTGRRLTHVCLALLTATSISAHAEMSTEELAKLAQNPVGNLISVPFQNNTNFNVGPNDGTQNVLNIQPVIPDRVEQGLEPDHAHDHAADLAAGLLSRAKPTLRPG